VLQTRTWRADYIYFIYPYLCITGGTAAHTDFTAPKP